jgi:hypothetical protein
MTKEERKAEARKARERYEHAMNTGDERYLPARDKGAMKRYIRDHVDSHFWLSEYFLFITIGMLILLFTMQTMSQTVTLVGMVALYGLIFVMMGDTYVRSRKLRKAVVAKFGECPRGNVSYGVMRAMSFRRSRRPKPQVAKGEFPS